jgi:outer membrane protein assembly factor BamE
MEPHLAYRRRRFPVVQPILAAAFAAVLLSGCAAMTSPFDNWMPYISQFGVYKIDINQGNFLSQDMVDKLKEGQTKQQVRLILGTPLVSSAFRDNRWDYVYQFQRNGRVTEHRQFTAYFAEEKLVRWEGDEMPQSALDLNKAAASRALKADVYGEDAGIIGKIIDWFRRIGNPAATPIP